MQQLLTPFYLDFCAKLGNLLKLYQKGNPAINPNSILWYKKYYENDP